MRRLEHHRLAIFARLVFQAGIGEGCEVFVEVGLVVDLVEGHPVLHFVLITLKRHAGKAHKEVDQFAVAPAAIFAHQVIGHFEVREGNNRLDAVLQALIKQIVIKLQACLVGLLFVTFGENTCPGNGGAEAFKAQFREQLDIFFVTVIEIDGFMIGVVFARQHPVGNFARDAMCACGHHVCDAWALPALLPAAFKLMRRYRAAPQKTLFES